MISARGTFCGSTVGGFNGRIAQGQKYAFGPSRVSAFKFLQGLEKSLVAEIEAPWSTIKSVKKSRQIYELGARINKIEIKELLAVHA